ncbi:unnamed protein product [Zymoseptoria tritici ST99CH_3D1]|nr:unnamed protein product [Zymoseptoria tritici ST99CH_3D1]
MTRAVLPITNATELSHGDQHVDDFPVEDKDRYGPSLYSTPSALAEPRSLGLHTSAWRLPLHTSDSIFTPPLANCPLLQEAKRLRAVYYDILADDILADDILADDILADDILADDILADDILADDILADDILADDILADDILADDILADDTLADHTLADDSLAEHIPAGHTLAMDELAVERGSKHKTNEQSSQSRRNE